MVGYVRVSTEDQGELGVGLEAQREAIRSACAARKWQLVAIHEDIASGKELTKRPGLAAAMAVIHGGEASGLVVAKLDRLSRSVVDAALTIERAKREGWNLVALDLGVDFSTAAGEAMANMTAVFAQLERRLIGERTRAALAVKKAQGVRSDALPFSPTRCAHGSLASAPPVPGGRPSPRGSTTTAFPLPTVASVGIPRPCAKLSPLRRPS